jgi:hypothetical protein
MNMSSLNHVNPAPHHGGKPLRSPQSDALEQEILADAEAEIVDDCDEVTQNIRQSAEEDAELDREAQRRREQAGIGERLYAAQREQARSPVEISQRIGRYAGLGRVV